VTNCS